MSLSIADFPAFFRAIHAHEPLPWQHRLAQVVLTTGWPRTLTLPTASGKTAVLDIAVFALAVQAHLPAAQRTACRRIVLVVDRRIVVDDASRRAETIRDRIAQATEGVLVQVREALLGLAGHAVDAQPLQVATLRGGMYREDRWARSPRQPVILCSTVDQVGSRLLHRGYGVSSRMAPIHAGLLGNDCCIILDEAHISEPFRQTLAQIATYRGRAEHAPVTPFQVVTMTATPRLEDEPFRLDAADRSHPVLVARLHARKEATLTLADRTDKELTKAALAAIHEVLAWRSAPEVTPDVRTVLVVFNRVASARALFDALTPSRKPPLDAEVLLLTGRARSLERDVLLAAYHARIMAGRPQRQPTDAKPLIVVATQCIEVGADLDLDALVTEAASLDALRQRLGRIDRLGQRGRSPVRVLIRADAVGTVEAPAEDPIYGTALSATWHWLNTLPERADGSRDLGIVGLEPYLPAPAACTPTALDAPIIFPAYCDLWVQTGPEPVHSPDPAIFLHGPQRQSAEVRLIWRADLDPQRLHTWADTIACCPPMTSEGLPLPLHVARAWLAGVEAKRLPDAGGDLPEAAPDKDPEPGREPYRALRWRGPEESIVVEAADIRPGDVLVVPCAIGGCDAHGWNPEARTTVDLADRAQIAARRPAVLRLTPALLDQHAYADLPEALRSLAQWRHDGEQDWPEDWQVAAALTTVPRAPGPLAELLQTVAASRWTCEPHPTGTGVVICSSRRLGLAFTDEDHNSSVADAPYALIPHLDDVQAWAAHHGAGLSAELAADLALAGHLHDLGKADPRFQAYLAGGDAIAAARAGVLAKSAGFGSRPH